ncbi:MAG: polysaccharide biosynthesis protein [SAR86 cluster bacterium]|uniref:Polysaccharide biosynthesis protein n=1 Tax=SAR86 cluster bacterium TaxID=2030880 RepID=A0A2A5B6X3_9GAMM|nr:MAG: polysaccharide biosynthesis protein [SAR86 cluster bacterium]
MIYKALFKNILYPVYESGIRRRKTLHYLKKLNQNQWMSLDELQALQWGELKKLLNHAYEQSPYYRGLFQTLNIHPDDIKSHSDFLKFPICSREEMVNHNQEMVARNYKDKVSLKTTGGSTGVPVQFALDRNSYEWRTAAAQRGYQWANCEAGQHTLYIWGVDVGNPSFVSRAKNALYHRLFNRTMFNCFNFDDKEMQRCLEFINAKRPTGIVSFTTAIYNLAKYIDDNDLQCASVPSIITGAEKLYDYQRELMEKVFQTKVFNTYGCREVMLIAAECEKHEGLHVTMDNLFVEILKDGKPAAPGESGEVVITDLHNYGMPFIRYKNGDIAVQSAEACSCGRGLPLIKDIDGRKMDEIVACDGKVVSGGFFPHLLKEIDEIQKFQVIQKTSNNLVIKLVQKQNIKAQQLEFCSAEIKKVLGDEMEIDFQFVDEIPLTPSGKYRVTISEIAQR